MDWIKNKIWLLINLARLNNPIGIFLLLFPCLLGITIASDQINLEIFTLFTLGAITMRSAGCIINDIVDRNLDKKTVRTKDRPLANEQLTLKEAYYFLLFLLIIGLLILIKLNQIVIILGLAIIPLIVLYPYMKRITYFPQLFLGIIFNWGVLMGYASIKNTLDPEIFFLYAACIFWTIGYDTIYAHQDKKTDVKIGIKSTAILFGKKTKLCLCMLYLLMILNLVSTGIVFQLTSSFYLITTVIFLHLMWQIYTLEINDPKNCLSRFKSNRWVGLAMLAAIIL
ncbi:MAG: 4-hydroxybenzoate octaprenyltransferase [Alphaproteobacteria bacterium MarineAlpha7_Bin1]|jgi:4-hydroxybenzoate polyprenyltransferase|nr:MAG: 4-hydroxybenzoate octaprenyltransferase [Alphaproteobacteria bacterium MarineAlpha7_Bin1]|tara:strand:- start:5392 stop:6240 length:849 start_codon:yes stop_codon:yes gene_type:complete